MPVPPRSKNLTPAEWFVQQPDLTRLLRATRRAGAQFALYFARCNSPALRTELTAALRVYAVKPIVEIDLADAPLETQPLDAVLAQQIGPPDAVLFVYGLEHWLPRQNPAQQQRILQQLNWRRSAIARIARSVVVWLPEYALRLLAEQAPDFHDWYSGIYEFEPPPDEQIERVRSAMETFGGPVHPADRLTQKEKQRWLEVLTSLLEDHPPPVEQARLSMNLGLIYHSLSDYLQALAYYQAGLNLYRSLGDKRGEGSMLNNISQIFKVRGDYAKALNYLKQSLLIQQEIDDKRGEGTTLNNISQIYHVRGDYDTALNYLQQSLAIRQEIGDKSGVGTAIGNISQIYAARGDYATALDYLQQSLAIQQEIGDKRGEGATLNKIAKIYRARGDDATALNYLQQSLAIRQEIGDKSGEGNALNNISAIYHARGDYTTALDYLKQSLAIQREIGDGAGLCVTLLNIGHIYLQNNEPQKAEQAWLEAQQIAQKIGHTEILQALEMLLPKRRPPKNHPIPTPAPLKADAP